MASHKRALLREEKTLEALKDEVSDITDLRDRVNYWLSKEQSGEWWTRLAILRKFESECASGTYEACDIQSAGVNPELSLFQNIIHGGYEDIDTDNDAASQAATKQRLSDERKKRKQREQQEGIGISQENTLIGRDRVMSTECPKMNYEIVTESRVARIHDTLAMYMFYVEGKSGAAARKLTTEQRRRQTTLFGAFLETQNGISLLVQVSFEVLGIILTPLWLPVKLVMYVVENMYNLSTTSIQQCAITAKPSLSQWNAKYEDLEVSTLQGYVIEEVFDEMEEYDYEEEWIEEGMSLKEKVWNILSGDYFTHLYKRMRHNAILWYRQAIEVQCTDSLLSKGVVAYYEAFLPGGVLAPAIEQLDYTRYNIIMQAIEIYRRHTVSLRWGFNIAYHSPIMWFQFIFTSAAASKLPVRRDACTLREAKLILEEELVRLIDRLDEEMILISEKKGRRSINGQAKNRETETTRKRKSPNSIDTNEAETFDPAERYGPSNEWEAVLSSQCLVSPLDGYKYEVCLFGEIKQNRKRLGSFQKWSDSLVTTSGGIDSPSLGNLFAVDGFQKVPLHHQMIYTDGEYCHATQEPRRAMVSFVCGEKPTLLSVDELEVTRLVYRMIYKMRVNCLYVCI